MKTKNIKIQNSEDVNISPEISRLLLELQRGTISIDDVSEKVQEMARRIDILKKHESFCKIWQATDGR